MSISVKYIGQSIENLSRKDTLSKRGTLHLTPEQLKSFKSVFRLLNKKDRDILYLIFVSRMKQKVVQNILNRSQPSLCYDIKRIKERVRFIRYLNSVSDIFLDFVEVHRKNLDQETIDVMVAMFYTTSLTQSSEVLKLPQVKIRYAFDQKCLGYLKSNRIWDVYEIFTTIRSNLNVIRRTYKNESQDNILDGVFIPV